jgi:transposase
MKEAAAMIRKYLRGLVAWAQTRQTDQFLEALVGLFRSAKRRVRGFTRLSTIRTVIFLTAGNSTLKR